jgi:hypothetical protein
MTQINKVGLLQWISAYLLWFGVILIVLAIILILRSVLQQWLIMLFIPPRVLWSTQQFFIYFAGVAWIIITFLVEGYFRNGLHKGNLWQRVKTVYQYLGIALGIALLALGSVEVYARWFWLRI